MANRQLPPPLVVLSEEGDRILADITLYVVAMSRAFAECASRCVPGHPDEEKASGEAKFFLKEVFTMVRVAREEEG